MKILGYCWAVLFIQVYAYSAVAADVRLQAKSDAKLDAARDITTSDALRYLRISGCVSVVASVPSVGAVFLFREGDVEAAVYYMGIPVCSDFHKRMDWYLWRFIDAPLRDSLENRLNMSRCIRMSIRQAYIIANETCDCGICFRVCCWLDTCHTAHIWVFRRCIVG